MRNELLERVFTAHGGLEHWNSFSMVYATIVSGGQLWDMKGTPQDATPREMKVATKHEWASVSPYGAPDQHTDFTPKRIAIEKKDGTVVSERFNPADHAEGKAIDTPWDALDRAYFNGYALWTYLTTPFLFALPEFAVEEIKPWQESNEIWRGLRVTLPPYIASHSKEQDFYFGPDFLLRRHDYHVEASGGFAAAQYVFDPITVQGITLPTKRRAYMRDEHLRPVHERLMVRIDISKVSFRQILDPLLGDETVLFMRARETNTGQFIEYEAVRVCTQSERTFLAANVSKQIMAPNGPVLRSLG